MSKKTKRKQTQTKQLILLFLGMLGVVATAYLATRPQQTDVSADKKKATIWLEPKVLNLKQGETGYLDIYIDSGSYDIMGVDAILRYDPQRIMITGYQYLKALPYYPRMGNLVNHEAGYLQISALAYDTKTHSPTTPLRGIKRLARLPVKALTNDSAEINFTFTLGSTNDTNLVDLVSQTDVASSATGAVVNP